MRIRARANPADTTEIERFLFDNVQFGDKSDAMNTLAAALAFELRGELPALPIVFLHCWAVTHCLPAMLSFICPTESLASSIDADLSVDTAARIAKLRTEHPSANAYYVQDICEADRSWASLIHSRPDRPSLVVVNLGSGEIANSAYDYWLRIYVAPQMARPLSPQRQKNVRRELRGMRDCWRAAGSPTQSSRTRCRQLAPAMGVIAAVMRVSGYTPEWP